MVQDAIVGSILGTAVGDAIGLPYEGLSRRRGRRLLGEPCRHRFFFGRGMVSDDTEHTCMVAQALIDSGADVHRFSGKLAWRLRWWLLGLPAGVGWATLKAVLKLWCGFSPQRSGVFSAGNGPAMRSAILGAAIDDMDQLRLLVSASTRITHTDPKAEYGALAVALAARMARGGAVVSGASYLEMLRSILPREKSMEFLRLIEAAVASAERGEQASSFADSQGWTKGVSGYVYHSVPVAIQAWLANQRDFKSAVMAAVVCGGDTDTTGAIVGGILGAGVGKAGIFGPWLDRLFEWPRTVAWMEVLGEHLAQATTGGIPRASPRLSAFGLLARNLLFFIIVLFHVIRRLLPPY